MAAYWRMTPEQKSALILEMSEAVREVAPEGIRKALGSLRISATDAMSRWISLPARCS